MEKRRFRWGLIPILGLVLLPLLSLMLLIAISVQLDPTFVGWPTFLRLFFDNSPFWLYYFNSFFTSLLGALFVITAALMLKKCVWDAQEHTHKQGRFYAVISAVLTVVVRELILESAGFSIVISNHILLYKSENVSAFIGKLSLFENTWISLWCELMPTLFLVALCLLLFYIADLLIPSRKQPVPSKGLCRAFSAAHIAFLTVSAVEFAYVGIQSVFYDINFIVVDEEGAYKVATSLTSAVVFAVFVGFTLLLLATELVMAVLFWIKGKKRLGIALIAVSVAAAIALRLIPPQSLMMSTYLLAQHLGVLDKWPLIGSFLTNHRQLHGFALLCCSCVVWLRLTMNHTKPTLPQALPDGN